MGSVSAFGVMENFDVNRFLRDTKLLARTEVGKEKDDLLKFSGIMLAGYVGYKILTSKEDHVKTIVEEVTETPVKIAKEIVKAPEKIIRYMTEKTYDKTYKKIKFNLKKVWD